MDKTYNHKDVEEKLYKFWEENKLFEPEVNPKGKPYTIILPPPNANADLHFGHAMMSVEDILIRYHRMKGYAALFLPGSDHAGFETQVVFEKHLAKEDKSRFDFDRETLYKKVWDFVQENKGKMESQLRRLGFSVDWSREKFTLDPDIIKIVYKTFKKMHEDGLIYRAKRLVNYCVKHGTSFSDLEVLHEERKAKLYYIKYPYDEVDGSITVATTRPETMLGDVAVAVNPKDKRYKEAVGKTVILPIMNRKIKVIADDAVDIEFGTGAVKVTPFHDPNDYEIAQRHNLEGIQVIDFDGKMTKEAGKFEGLRKEARGQILEQLQKDGLLEKEETVKHQVPVCYKCQTIIEPLPLEQWFIKIAPLAKPAMESVRKGDIKIYPENFAKTYFQWMENIKDWNISRQIVWGMQIPAWKCKDCNEWIVTEGEVPKMCSHCKNTKLERDPDVFDTWFSSGQWPFATLQTAKLGDFEKFYPTSVMETGRDILFFWVARMIMLGIYNTGKIPFQDIVLHGTVLDPLGKKMSKSKGNVVSPIEIADQYGADAARMALVYGTAFGHDQALSHPKLQAMRNFTNKLWNIGRYIIEFKPEGAKSYEPSERVTIDWPEDKEIMNKLTQTILKVTRSLDQYRFHDAAEALYELIWHQFADIYIEKSKSRRAEAQPVLEHVFKASLELLHPFVPFVTEELWQRLPHKEKSIMIAPWPRAK